MFRHLSRKPGSKILLLQVPLSALASFAINEKDHDKNNNNNNNNNNNDDDDGGKISYNYNKLLMSIF